VFMTGYGDKMIDVGHCEHKAKVTKEKQSAG
jgi:hypothetical protein